MAFASIVFPLPGGHCKIILCPPAAAIIIARFACSCQQIVEKSIQCFSDINGVEVISFLCSNFLCHVKKSTTSTRFSTPIISIPGIIAASRALSNGTKIYFFPCFFAKIVAGNTPFTPRMEPSSASSPRNNELSTTSPRKSSSFPIIPRAMGRS